jgi:electron transfer flavoprotein alpha subunit
MAETILFLAHPEPDGSLSRISLEALAVARSLDGELIVGLSGGDAASAANMIGGCGAARFLCVTGAAFNEARYATDAAAAEALARASGASIIIAPQTSRWARVAGGVAHRLGGSADTHVASVDAADRSITRWYYRQRIEAVLQRSIRPWFLLIESGCAPAWRTDAAPVTITPISVDAGPQRARVEGRQAPRSAQKTIRPDAALLFVAGAGWTKKQKDGAAHVDEAARLILDFINASQASLGSSKSLVDISGEGQAVLPFLSHLNQVGQTGATPRHPKGLATCCHGEEPHVVGWRFIKERRAVNLDGNCGWARGKADVLYVADAFAVIEQVNALLAERREARARA